MMTTTFLLVTISIMIGLLCSALLTRNWRNEIALNASLAIGIGLGSSSVIFFLGLEAFGPRPMISLVVELLLLATLATCIWWWRHLQPEKWDMPSICDSTTESPARWLPRLLFLLLIFVVVIKTAVFMAQVQSKPHGDWDAWGIWNQRARFLALAGDGWPRAFSRIISWSHPDYPLLIPGSVARIWLAAGELSSFVPAIIAGLFTIGVLSLLIAGTAFLSGWAQGYLAGICLLAANGFMDHAASQYADVPLSFFFLATLLAIGLHARLEQRKWLVLAGLTASLAAWTKNEGLVFFLLVGLTVVLVGMFKQGWRSACLDILYFLLGAGPGVMCLLIFKLHLAPSNDLVAGVRVINLEGQVTNLGRHAKIIKSFYHQMLHCFGLKSLWLLIGIYTPFVGIRVSQQLMHLSGCVMVLSGMLVSYYLVFLTTPYDLTWHLNTALDRLFYQMVPCLIFLIFAVLKSPGQKARVMPTLMHDLQVSLKPPALL